MLPGLVVVAAATAVAVGLGDVIPGLNPATCAVLLGALLANTGLHTEALRPGTHLAAHRVLRLAVVLLGFQLSATTVRAIGPAGALLVAVTVAVTFTGMLVLGRLFGLSTARSLLLASGYSICGASAVAAVRDAVDADEDDVAVAVALVTLCGSLAIVVLPALHGVLGLDPVQFGSWVGASVHDVGQTVATAQAVPGALAVAMVIKLSRVALLLPLVAVLGLRARRINVASEEQCPGAPTPSDATRVGVGVGVRTPVLPLFLLGFVTAFALNSTGWVPAPALTVLHQTQHIALVAALVGLGTGIHRRVLRRAGGPALLVGLGGWVLVAGTALGMVHLAGITG
ncbi:MAG TPA: putative sulfate exporter family transporter [Sporichthyaceae bacterium]